MRVHQTISDDERRPIRLSCFGSLRRQSHVNCLVLTVLIDACLAAITLCNLPEDWLAAAAASMITPPPRGWADERAASNPCLQSGYVYIPVGLAAILYVVYLGECWHSQTRIDFRSAVDASAIYQQIRAMRQSPPVVWWRIVCYHYARRLRQVTRRRQGETFATASQISYERVTSQVSTTAFDYTRLGVRDVTKRLVQLERHAAVRMRFTKKFAFVSADAERNFMQQRSSFISEHETLDDCIEFTEGMDLLNLRFPDQVFVLGNASRRPRYLSPVAFWVASALLLSWPLRLLIGYHTAEVQLEIRKEFGCNLSDANPASRGFTRGASRDTAVTCSEQLAVVPGTSGRMTMSNGYRSDSSGGSAGIKFIPLSGGGASVEVEEGGNKIRSGVVVRGTSAGVSTDESSDSISVACRQNAELIPSYSEAMSTLRAPQRSSSRREEVRPTSAGNVATLTSGEIDVSCEGHCRESVGRKDAYTFVVRDHATDERQHICQQNRPVYGATDLIPLRFAQLGQETQNDDRMSFSSDIIRDISMQSNNWNENSKTRAKLCRRGDPANGSTGEQTMFNHSPDDGSVKHENRAGAACFFNTLSRDVHNDITHMSVNRCSDYQLLVSGELRTQNMSSNTSVSLPCTPKKYNYLSSASKMTPRMALTPEPTQRAGVTSSVNLSEDIETISAVWFHINRNHEPHGSEPQRSSSHALVNRPTVHKVNLSASNVTLTQDYVQRETEIISASNVIRSSPMIARRPLFDSDHEDSDLCESDVDEMPPSYEDALRMERVAEYVENEDEEDDDDRERLADDYHIGAGTAGDSSNFQDMYAMSTGVVECGRNSCSRSPARQYVSMSTRNQANLEVASSVALSSSPIHLSQGSKHGSGHESGHESGQDHGSGQVSDRVGVATRRRASNSAGMEDVGAQLDRVVTASETRRTFSADLSGLNPSLPSSPRHGTLGPASAASGDCRRTSCQPVVVLQMLETSL